MAGNPNPSPETRFQPGQSGNPGGKTSEHVAAERKAAELAALMRLQMLSSMQEKISAGLDPMDLVSSDVVRLFKDSEDRAHGTPKATVAGTGENGEHLHKVTPDDAFATFAAALGGHAPGTGGSNHGAGEVEGDGTA